MILVIIVTWPAHVVLITLLVKKVILEAETVIALEINIIQGGHIIRNKFLKGQSNIVASFTYSHVVPIFTGMEKKTFYRM